MSTGADLKQAAEESYDSKRGIFRGPKYRRAVDEVEKQLPNDGPGRKKNKAKREQAADITSHIFEPAIVTGKQIGRAHV